MLAWTLKGGWRGGKVPKCRVVVIGVGSATDAIWIGFTYSARVNLNVKVLDFVQLSGARGDCGPAGGARCWKRLTPRWEVGWQPQRQISN